MDTLKNIAPKAPKFVKVNLAIIFVFGMIYAAWFIIKEDDWNVPTQPGKTKTDVSEKIFNGFYFSTVMHTSVGYGDIYPLTDAAKVAIMIHATSIFLLNLWVGFS